MTSLQTQFLKFHDAIKLDEDNEKAKLREKRDLLLQELRNALPKSSPSFENFHQGSYAMNTGVAPLDGDYDIDIGLIFNCKTSDYPDPVELKKQVKAALVRSNRTIDIRRPCVTVKYIRQGDVEYHVDLALYAYDADNNLNLSIGKENSTDDNRFWQKSDPQRLTSLIKNRYNGEEAAQYRRCIRYLKRWASLNFSNGGCPISIALTVAAFYWFQPVINPITGQQDDLTALRNWCQNLLAKFTHNGGLTIQLPVEPYSDLMSKMTINQKVNLKAKLEKLCKTLADADVLALAGACDKLRQELGDDYPDASFIKTPDVSRKPYGSIGTSA